MDECLANETQKAGESEFREGGESGADNVEINSTENGISNKRMKEMEMDRLSALPDCLLIHILSFLGLKKAAITSLLGKRWKFLWTELSTLEFSLWEEWESRDKITKARREFVARVHKTLATRHGKCLEKMDIRFHYNECFASDVDSWLGVALKLKVKHVVLSLSSSLFSEHVYTLPEKMYTYSSLTSLSLHGCIFEPEREIKWQSFTYLDISNVYLPQPILDNILSGCPVLTRLHLSECWGFTCFEIHSQNLGELSVHDSFQESSDDDFFKISAPHLKSLNVSSLDTLDTKLKFSNISSLVSASFHFYDVWNSGSEDMLSNTREIFESIQHVKKLEVGCEIIKALVAVLSRGHWQLPKSMRRCLTISSFIHDKENISGILGLLESSPNLETLVIERYDPHEIAEENWVIPGRSDMGCDLLHLKTVKLYSMADPKLGGEPLLTLARILLERAPALEEMVIGVRVENVGDFAKIGQALLTYPRASPKAVISFLS
ncbi:unnamed protein product [Cuscuta campestris]|uniref:FBD domain-containing protein n=1 Tax=Cuscuta campestris TaxID=132261 RepID=A0A484LCM4_9ASTE|nr:unnamed protein product [Cuscuta campestris]